MKEQQNMPSISSILTIAGGIFLVIWGFFTGKTMTENKQLNREAGGVKTARKIEDENRDLTRNELIDKL